MLHEEQFDFLNKTITSMFAVRCVQTSRSSWILPESKKTKSLIQHLKWSLTLDLNKPLIKRGWVRGWRFTRSVQTGPPWCPAWFAGSCPACTDCRDSPHSWGFSNQTKNHWWWDGEYTSWQSPPRCHRCSAWCSPCTGCQTSLMRKKVVAYICWLYWIFHVYSTLEYQFKYSAN